MKKPWLYAIIIAGILLFFSLLFGLYEVQFFNSRASVITASFSVDNSYIFVSPLRAGANGQEKIRLTIFILDNQGIGVAGKKINIAIDPALKVEAIQGLTDSFGKAYFDISTTKPGEYFLAVKADDRALKQQAHLIFD